LARHIGSTALQSLLAAALLAVVAPARAENDANLLQSGTPLDGALIESNDAVIPGPPEPALSVPEANAAPAAETPPDLLARLRKGMQLPDLDQNAIDVQLSWYARNPEYLERVFGRAELYLYHIVGEVEARGMPLELALLPVVESAFEPFAYSRSHAAGLWQFIPGTGKRFGLPQNWWYDGRRDVMESTRAALDYLQFMHDEFNGDWLLAVAGYNCGEYCVARAIRENQARGLPIDFWSLRLPSETRAYVPKLLAMSRLIANPELYGIGFSHIPNEPYFARVDTGGQIDLKLAAEMAGISYDELTELNPAYHRWATPPQGPHYLLLPLTAADTFRQGLGQLTPDEMMRVAHHTVRRGETMASVAKRYSTQPLVVRQLNDLDGGKLLVGSEIRVPSGSTTLPDKVARAAARVDGGGSRRGRIRGGSRPSIHVVRRGDSLWAIAKRTGIDVRTLARLNGLKPNEKLRMGDRLVLAQANGTRSRSARSSSGSSKDKLRYRVRRGDTLYRIARLYNVSVTQLRSWNNLASAASIRVGQTIEIFLPQRR
jgi:membrane-bound lytic murein transglycosylase D